VAHVVRLYGRWVALKLAVNKLMKPVMSSSDPLVDPVAGDHQLWFYADSPCLDLDYPRIPKGPLTVIYHNRHWQTSRSR